MKKVVVIADGGLSVEPVLGALSAAGLEAVTANSVGEARTLVEGGAIAIVVGLTGSAWEGERSAPIHNLLASLRRGCVVVLAGQGLVSSDGTKAFLSGVDLVVGNVELPRLGEILCAAIARKRALVSLIDPAAGVRLGG